MRFTFLVLMLALMGCLGMGCVSTEPAKFESSIHTWVPLGTTLKQARETMKHHGFECTYLRADSRFNPIGKSYLDCEKPNYWMHNWNVRFFLVDDKVAEYGDITIE